MPTEHLLVRQLSSKVATTLDSIKGTNEDDSPISSALIGYARKGYIAPIYHADITTLYELAGENTNPLPVKLFLERARSGCFIVNTWAIAQSIGARKHSAGEERASV